MDVRGDFEPFKATYLRVNGASWENNREAIANRTQVLALTVDARAAIQSARFATGIRDRLQRFLTQDYPAQLALLARLASPPPKTRWSGRQSSPAAGLLYPGR